MEDALTNWAAIEVQRVFLAHGVGTVLLNRHGGWHVQFDFTAYRGAEVEPRRWNLSHSEADAFEAQLTAAFEALSRELGQLKKRLAV